MTELFDGTSLNGWRMSTVVNQPGQDDPGSFTVEDGALVAHPGTDLGLLVSTVPAPRNFELSLEFRLSALDDNTGVFVRFPDIDSYGYNNTAWVAIDHGFEVQIDETGRPDGAPEHTTGAVYEQQQEFTRVVARAPGEWNQMVIRVEEQVYVVMLNGTQVTRFENTSDSERGTADPGFIGLQTHSGSPAFRNIRISAL